LICRVTEKVRFLSELMRFVARNNEIVFWATDRYFFGWLFNQTLTTVEDRPKLTQRFHYRLLHI